MSATELSIVHSDPDILGGTPVFVGTRVPVGFSTLAGFLVAEAEPTLVCRFPLSDSARSGIWTSLVECFRGSSADWPAVPTSMEAVAAVTK